MENILDSLKWRYATKKYDAKKKLTEPQLNTLLEALRLSPSSYGLQPWKFIVVSNPKMREKLREAAYGQSPVTDASHLIILAIEKNLDEKFVDTYLESVADARGVSVEMLKDFGAMMKGSVNARSAEQNREWATKQLYIALGVLLTAAAHERIDATPMEGFDPKKFDEILSLEKMGLESRVIAAVGFRSADDKTAEAHKARFKKEDVIFEVK